MSRLEEGTALESVWSEGGTQYRRGCYTDATPSGKGATVKRITVIMNNGSMAPMPWAMIEFEEEDERSLNLNVATMRAYVTF